MDKSGPRIRRMFSGIARRYDLLNHMLSAGVDVYWRRRAVHSVQLDDGIPVLDVCTGTGDLAQAWWRRGGGRVTVLGTDFAHEMLRRAKIKAERRGAGISYIEADTLSLPLLDDSFGVVSVAFGLRNLADPQAGLAEMVRVCRPGGVVLILEFSMPRTPLIGRAYRFYFRKVLPRLGNLISGDRDRAYLYLSDSVSEFPQGEDVLDWLRVAGLVDVSYRLLTCGIATLYRGRKPGGTDEPAGGIE